MRRGDKETKGQQEKDGRNGDEMVKKRKEER